MSVKTPFHKVSTDAFSRTESLITPDQVKARYLFGIDLTDLDGNEIPTETIQHSIDAAVSYMEMKLDITIFKTDFKEKYDYRSIDYNDFNFMSLKKRPVCEVTKFRAKFPTNRELVEYPTEWFVVEQETGQFQISPVEGTFSGLIVTQGGAYVPLIYGTRNHWPHLFEVEYTAGFEPDCIPTVLNEMIGMQTAIRLFEILGDIVLGPGTAGESVGLDGANVSKQTTASAMFHAFSARVESYRKQLDDYVDTVRKHYNGFAFTVG